MQEPDWLTKELARARAEGRVIAEMSVNAAALPADIPVKFLKEFPLVQRRVNDLPLDERFASEADFQKAVIELAHFHLALVGHFRKVRVADGSGETHWETPVGADGKGWPDLYIAIEGKRPIIAELKVGKNVPTPEQWEWINRLRSCGMDVRVWYPSDWAEIVDALAHPEAVEARHAVQRMVDDGCPHTHE